MEETMDKLKKFDLMEKICRELEDVRNSQQAVLEKIGKIEVDNIELGDQILESRLPEIYQQTADTQDVIKEVLEAFQQKTDEFGDANRSEEHTSELQSRENLVCRLLLEKKKEQIVGVWNVVGRDGSVLIH